MLKFFNQEILITKHSRIQFNLINEKVRSIIIKFMNLIENTINNECLSVRPESKQPQQVDNWSNEAIGHRRK